MHDGGSGPLENVVWYASCEIEVQRQGRGQRCHSRAHRVRGRRAIRRGGYGGAGVADIMKEAGLTHGAFYAHFASREAMLAEAAARACAESAAAVAEVVARGHRRWRWRPCFVPISKEHCEHADTGCPWPHWVPKRRARPPRSAPSRDPARQGSDRPGGPPDPGLGKPGAHDRALVTVATMVGALLLARAVDDPALPDSLREAALRHLTLAGH